MSYKSFKVSKNAGVAEIALARPERSNALTTEFVQELPAAASELENAGDTRVILLSGEGKHFCSGMDLTFFAGDMLNTNEPRERERFRRLVIVFQEALSALEKSRIPVIAAIHGACVGAGIDLISACDMRFGSKDAFFCVQEVNLGIMADMGTLQRLPKLMPEGIVRELAYSGDRFDSQRAMDCGLLNNVFDSQDEMLTSVRALCERIASRSPLAVAATKEAITFVRDHSVEDALQYAASWQAAIFDKNQILKAIEAQKNRTNVEYENLLPIGLPGAVGVK
jgi:enoyl-CoA hydratase